MFNRWGREDMSRLVVGLSPDRNVCGILNLYDAQGRRICGPFPVAGRSTDARAAANGNPSRNPLVRFGDTPTGVYQVRDVLKSGRATPFEAARFGPNGIVVLEAVSGDAVLAEGNGRFHILIVGGKLSATGKLQSTAGSLRLSDENQRTLNKALRKLHGVSCEIEEHSSLKSRLRVCTDNDCKDDDPQNLSWGPTRPRTWSPSGRELLLGSAAGAMILEAAFVAVPPSPAHALETRAHENSLQIRYAVKFLPPAIDSRNGYVQIAYGGPAPVGDGPAGNGGPTEWGGSSGNPPDLPNIKMHSPDTPPAGGGPTTQPATGPTPPVQSPSGGPTVDPIIQQQRQINAIQSEKPPPNVDLNQWQQNQQNRIQQILKPPSQPTTAAPSPAPENKTIVVPVYRGKKTSEPPPPPKPDQ
jgi:hypothetical protein